MESGCYLLTKLQAEFTKYMEMALRCDAIDFYRTYSRKNKHKELLIEDINNVKVSASLNGEVGTSFFDYFDDEIKNERLKYAISKLTFRQKQIFELYADGYKSKEIAEILNITVKNVTVTVSNVKKKLYKLMKGE